MAGIAIAVVLMGCSNNVKVHGTFDEVWERTQTAMKGVSFDAAGVGANNERIDLDRRKGKIKYVWSGGDFYDAVVLTLTITPAEAGSGLNADAAAVDRTIHIDAWTWAFGGWAQASDPHATEQAYKALNAEFHPEPVTVPQETAVQRARRQLPPGSPVYQGPDWPRDGNIATP